MRRAVFWTGVLLLAAVLAATGPGLRADSGPGFDAYSEGDYDSAFAVWQPLAEAGDAAAQFGLGLLYSNGWGVAQDDAAALDWYTRAADQGHAEAQYNIGVMYQNGWGVEQNDAEAFRRHRMAAENGFPAAQRSLGSMYSYGMGTEVDRVEAYKWFAIASLLGDSESNFSREELEQSLSPQELSEANAQAEQWIADFGEEHGELRVERQ